MQQHKSLQTVTEAIHWIYSSYNRAKPALRPGYDREVRHPEWTGRLLQALGNPDYCGYNVAVTGSKGKGSHAILLAGILQQLGFRVGLFTSPHLVDFLERIRVDGQAISDHDFVRYLNQVAACAEQLHVPDGQYLGPVGLLAVAAALWFRDCATDVNVFELGRGARHDDVNQIRHQGAVMSPVFLEHARQLGPTLRDVAWEKAGVVTEDTEWLCCHTQSAIVEQTFADILPARVEIRLHARDFGQAVQVNGTWLEVAYPEATYQLRLPNAIGFIRDNALVAFDAARTIWRKLRPTQPMPTVVDLSRLRLPGRLEVVDTAPLTVLDGTIHEQSARFVAEWVSEQRQTGQFSQVGAVLSLPADKDGEGVVRQLANVADWLLFTRAHNPHLVYDGRFLSYAESLQLDAEEEPYPEDALSKAKQRLPGSGLLLLVGTQSFVGDVLRWYGKNPLSIWNNV